MFNKKYLEYKFRNKEHNQQKVAEELIVDILEKSTPKSSCWWSSLDVNIGGWKSQFEYVISMHLDMLKRGIFNSPEPSIRTAKTCPAVLGVINNTYLIKSPAELLFTIDSEGKYVWNASNDLISINSGHNDDQFITDNSNLFNNKKAIKFVYNIELTTPNIPYIFIQPIYHNDMWFTVTPGIVSDNYTKGVQLNVVAFVDIPKEGEVTHTINFGDVLAYLWFPEQIELKHSTNNSMFISDIKKKWQTKQNY